MLRVLITSTSASNEYLQDIISWRSKKVSILFGSKNNIKQTKTKQKQQNKTRQNKNKTKAKRKKKDDGAMPHLTTVHIRTMIPTFPSVIFFHRIVYSVELDAEAVVQVNTRVALSTAYVLSFPVMLTKSGPTTIKKNEPYQKKSTCTFGHVCPVKIQIRLRNRAVWSKFSLGAVW